MRITVDRDEAAAAVPQIRDRLARCGVTVPLIGDFHYIGHKLLADHPACAEALDKYRINPGNVGFKNKRDTQFATIIETAIRYGKPVRIGVNWGSLDQELLTRLMDENCTRRAEPQTRARCTREAMVQSALLSARAPKRSACAKNRIILSAKVSAVQDLIAVYTELARALRLCAASRPHRSRHGLEGHRRLVGRDGRAAAAGHRRHHPRLADAGAGRRPHARSAGRAGIAADHGLPHLRAAGRGLSRLRPHHLDDVPGAGRATSRISSATSMPEWKKRYPGVETLNVAVMGCIVNGPGESKHADIGISLPGTGEQPTAPVFIDGKKVATLRGPTLAADFKQMVNDYIERRFGPARSARRSSSAASRR